jgi:hypothetical protein
MPTLNTHFTVAEEQTSASYSLVNRAEPDELSVGDFVEWDSSGGMAQGQIATIETDGEIAVPDTDFVITGTEDDPAALIRLWRESENDDGEMEWNPTDVFVGHKFSTLTLIDALDERVKKRALDLTPPAWVRAIARSAADATPEILAVTNNAMTPAMWVEAREMLADSGNIVWGVVLTDRAATRFLDFANEVIGRIEEENEGRAKGQALSKMETRINSAKFEVRETDEGMQFSGYAAVFNSDSEPLPFIERIAPGAFKGSLRNRNDIKLLWNHDTASVLGSTRAGTLRVTEDARGLFVEADLPNTSTGRDARELIGRGDVDSMSFGFTVARNGDEWSADGSVRTLTKINLHEVSIVAFPAYTATAGSTAVRGIDKVALRAGVDADVLADALLKIENGEDITSADRQLLASVIDELAPAEQVEQPKGDFDMLALKKKKLELLMGL